MKISDIEKLTNEQLIEIINLKTDPESKKLKSETISAIENSIKAFFK